MWQILQGPHFVLGQRTLSANVQDRALGSKSIGNPSHRIGAAGTGGRHDAAGLESLSGVAIRRVCGNLFMTHINDANAFVNASVVDVDNVSPA